ncbi:LysR family transcriptional regulator [Paenibacillus aurantius]|uniref:LysR family transcriptional regulator n=1 Tax=Paenibacillus aurantius TaxID=2918900 RepID=A0AA96RFG1_9BACL|nr:LysR family transcriptional regulator [Paenibacillus aurantius]WNQ11203.1 LysR family transcriptional regulator [Paenibacillus aurantius]
MDQALHVFVTVAEQQNFTRAAELLHMTQPAVSSYIQNLERSMDIKLLERTNKFVRLTKAGEMVYHHAKEILGLYTRMENLLDDLKHTASGNLSIGSSYTYGEYILPHRMAALLKSYPQLNPSITIRNSNEIMDLVLHHQIDVGIIEGEVKNEKIKIMPFACDHLSILAASDHRLFHTQNISPLDLSEETWLIREEGSGTRGMQEKGFQQLGFYPNKRMTLGSTQVIKESIEAGLGISLLSQSAIQKELELGKLKLLDIEGFPIKRNFSLITPNVPFQTKAAEVFIKLLVEEGSTG